MNKLIKATWSYPVLIGLSNIKSGPFNYYPIIKWTSYDNDQNVIVGAPEAGLSTSYHLTAQGAEHILLEQADKPANAWINRTWDSFTLVTPNWGFGIPGAEKILPNMDPDGFMPRRTVISFFGDYIDRFGLPVIYNTRVISINSNEQKGFHIETTDEVYEAKNVVIATGFHQSPKIPEFAANISTKVKQLHSKDYRNPKSVKGDTVLVVGSGQSRPGLQKSFAMQEKKFFYPLAPPDGRLVVTGVRISLNG